uniref:Uncharacterized protein n=1 Tax=Romanomermis culicivorax TaxID=13658 RepID=A0A915KSG0_ROMCU
YTILTKIPESRCACPTTWIAGPSSKFPGCFKAWNGTGGRTGYIMPSASSLCRGMNRISHLLFLPNLTNGTDLTEL